MKIFEISLHSQFFGLFWPILAYIRFFCISEAISVEIIATRMQFQNSTTMAKLEHIMLRKAPAHFFGPHFVCLPRIIHYIHIYIMPFLAKIQENPFLVYINQNFFEILKILYFYFYQNFLSREGTNIHGDTASFIALHKI